MVQLELSHEVQRGIYRKSTLASCYRKSTFFPLPILELNLFLLWNDPQHSHPLPLAFLVGFFLYALSIERISENSKFLCVHVIWESSMTSLQQFLLYNLKCKRWFSFKRLWMFMKNPRKFSTSFFYIYFRKRAEVTTLKAKDPRCKFIRVVGALIHIYMVESLTPIYHIDSFHIALACFKCIFMFVINKINKKLLKICYVNWYKMGVEGNITSHWLMYFKVICKMTNQKLK